MSNQGPLNTVDRTDIIKEFMAGIVLGTQGNPPTPDAGKSLLYSDGTVIKAKDASGNITQVSAVTPTTLGLRGGPLFPYSAVPVTANNLFWNVHVSGGANSKHEEGMGVVATPGADSIWRLRFQLPPLFPPGTATLVCRAQAAATSGVARVNPKWVCVAAGGDPAGPALSAEGVTPDSKVGQAGSTDTLEWGAGDTDQYLEARWILNAATLNAAQPLIMDLTFETSGFTLAVTSTWRAYIEWV